MLASLNDVLEYAEKRQIAIGAFNVVNYECIRAILNVAEKLQTPIILSFAQTHEENKVAFLDEMGPIMVSEACRSIVPVVVHLDHGIDLSYLRKALDLGFTSIMYDGSSLPFEENVRRTQLAALLAKGRRVSIEAEIGKMAGITLNNQGVTENRASDRSMYTDPLEAKEFVKRTGVDCLAASFGTVHGEYRQDPNIDFELVASLKRETGVPIVMHGGSGVSEEDYKRVIQSGVRKINYFTYMDKAGRAALDDLDHYHYFHEITQAGQLAMEENIEKALRCFSNLD